MKRLGFTGSALEKQGGQCEEQRWGSPRLELEEVSAWVAWLSYHMPAAIGSLQMGIWASCPYDEPFSQLYWPFHLLRDWSCVQGRLQAPPHCVWQQHITVSIASQLI